MNGLRLAYHLTKGILKINRLDSTTPIVLNSTKDKTGLRRTQSPFSVSGFLFHSTEQQESSGDRQARRHRLKVKTTWKPWQKLKKGQRVTEWLPCPWWTGEERKCPSRVPNRTHTWSRFTPSAPELPFSHFPPAASQWFGGIVSFLTFWQLHMERRTVFSFRITSEKFLWFY